MRVGLPANVPLMIVGWDDNMGIVSHDGRRVMDRDLIIQALAKLLAGIVVMGLLLFVPAGTASWWNGRLLMAVLFVVCNLLMDVFSALVDPRLRERGLN